MLKNSEVSPVLQKGFIVSLCIDPQCWFHALVSLSQGYGLGSAAGQRTRASWELPRQTENLHQLISPIGHRLLCRLSSLDCEGNCNIIKHGKRCVFSTTLPVVSASTTFRICVTPTMNLCRSLLREKCTEPLILSLRVNRTMSGDAHACANICTECV